MKTYIVNYNKKNILIDTDDHNVQPKSFTFEEIGINEFDNLNDLKEQLLGEDIPDEKRTRLPFYQENDVIEFWLIVDYDKLMDVLKRELISALDASLQGWRIPIYINTMSGEITAGSWLSQGNYQPDAFEFYSIKQWEIDWEEHLNKGETINDLTEDVKTNIIVDELDQAIHFHMNRIKDKIKYEYNQDAIYHNTMSDSPDFYIDLAVMWE